ncbi:MAG: T9SS type A sorting domain-containing protein [Bacteroidetes bacterium]|nr:MAG: T9SS type A sorting domain-containing protein [Bacteroidota bacterium]
MKTKNLIILVIVFGVFFFVKPAFAANHYIRAEATGANNGESWTDAWTNFGEVTWTRGDTYYVAGGTFNENISIPSTSGTSWITIKKANVSDNGNEPGWEDYYATNQVVINGNITSLTGSVEIDGVTGSDTSGHGIKINVTTSLNVVMLSNGTGPYHLSHLELKGPGFDYGSLGTDGIYYNFGQKGFYVAYCWIHEIPRNGITIGSSIGTSYSDYGMLYENNVLSETGGVGIAYPGIHGQGIQIGYSATDSFIIIRNNTFRNIYGQGPISYLGKGTHSQSRIYNNVFYSTEPGIYANASAIFWHAASVNVSDMYVYNNTFYNLGGYGSHIRCDFTGATNLEIKNNIWVKCPFGNHHYNFTSASNNDYFENTGMNIPTGEPNQVTESEDPFVNSAEYDLHLKYTANAVNNGLSLNSIFTTDKDAISRPQGAGWDIGAYEYKEPSSVEKTSPEKPLTYNFPNPFQYTSNIEYTLPNAGNITIKIYDMQEQLLRDLYSGSIDAGMHIATWDGRTDTGSEAPSGVYMYRIQFEGQAIIGKMVVVR